jgi:hypothetical protein
MEVSLHSKDINFIIDLLNKGYSKYGIWDDKNNKSYKNGLLNNENFTYKAEFIGLSGELAFSKLTNKIIDSNITDSGNLFDFEQELKNVTFSKYKKYVEDNRLLIDIKTISQNKASVFVNYLKDSFNYYIKATKDYNPNQLIELKSNVYVFAKIIYPDFKKIRSNDDLRNINKVIVKFDGFINKNKINKNNIGYSLNRNAKFKNYYINKSELFDMDLLLRFIKLNGK